MSYETPSYILIHTAKVGFKHQSVMSYEKTNNTKCSFREREEKNRHNIKPQYLWL